MQRDSHSSFFFSRRIFPLFVTQFFGAFNDNAFKNALLIYVIYSATSTDVIDQRILVNLAAGLFILPFFLFSSIAGQLADQHDKSKLARYIKCAEIGLMLLALGSFFWKSIWLLLFTLFLMGTQSAFFGPIKYSLLPEQLSKDELLKGNAYINAGTFVAILLGSIFGGILIMDSMGVYKVCGPLIAFAALGYYSSRYIPTSRIQAPKEPFHMVAQAKKILSRLFQHKVLFSLVIALSWFWFLGSTLLTQFPSFVNNTMNATPETVVLCLCLFTIGISIGSFLSYRFLNHVPSIKLLPISSIGITATICHLYFQSSALPLSPSVLTVMDVISSLAHLGLLADILIIAIFGGLFYVPLYALFQSKSNPQHCAQNIAANNIVNAGAMAMSAILCSLFLLKGGSVIAIFLITGVFTSAVGISSYWYLNKRL